MSSRRKKALTVGVGILLFACLTAFVGTRPVNQPPPLPNPNGYDDFVKAGLVVPNFPNNDVSKIPPDQLRPLVAQCEAAIALMRPGLDRECQVPVEYSPEFMSRRVNQIMAVKSMGRALVASARLAEHDGRPAEATAHCLDAIALGQLSCRKGLMIDGLVGIAVESMGATKLASLRPTLDAATCRAAIKRLEELESKRESSGAILEVERQWVKGSFTLAQRLGALVQYKSQQSTRQSFISRHHQQTTATRQLTLDLAARAYELDHGKPPAKAADLTPAYLRRVPRNPESDLPLTLP
ncbi:MAG: hypothetical protein AB1705_01410 [Verrucomicrobiota bacterium]